MPNLVGLTKLDALAKLDEMTLDFTVVDKDVPGIAKGIVASQSPLKGSKITSTTVVVLTVSTGGTSTNKPPTAAFSWSPANPAINANVHFDAGASTDDGTIVKWVWEYDDGTTDSSSGKVTNHKFTTAGPHEVTLWITDNGGTTVSLTKTVTVL
jgi:PKD repeat protein